MSVVLKMIEELKHPAAQGDRRDARDKLVLESYRLLLYLESKRVSLRQRMQISYAFSQLYADDDSYGQSMRSLQRAREIAEQTGDQAAQIQLFRQEGEISHRSGRLTQALTAYANGLHLLKAHDEQFSDSKSNQMGHSNPNIELQLLVGLSGLEMEKAQFVSMRQHIRDAHALFEIVGRSANTLKARLAWVEVQDLRRRGHYQSALDMVGKVVERLERSAQNEAPTAMLARAYLVAMDAAIDVGGAYRKQSTIAAGYLAQAKVYRDQAQTILRTVDDPITVGLLKVANHRYVRACKPESNQMNLIEKAMYHGETQNDAALLGRAYTGLGQELEAHGDLQNARDAYRFAQYLLARHDFITLSHAPEEALNRIDRQS